MYRDQINWALSEGASTHQNLSLREESYECREGNASLSACLNRQA